MMRNFVLPISARFNLHGKKRLDIYVYYSTYCTAIIVVHDFSCPYIVKDALLYMGKQSFLFYSLNSLCIGGGVVVPGKYCYTFVIVILLKKE